MEEQHIEDRALLLLESWHGRGSAAQMRLHATLLSAWRLKRELRIPFNEAVSMARDWAKGRRPLLDLEPDELMQELQSIGKVSLILFAVPRLLAPAGAFFAIWSAPGPINWPVTGCILVSIFLLSQAFPKIGITGRAKRILRIIERSPHPDFLRFVNDAMHLCTKPQRRMVRPAFKAVLESCRTADLSQNSRDAWLRKVAQDCPDLKLQRLASEVLANCRRHAYSKVPHR